MLFFIIHYYANDHVVGQPVRVIKYLFRKKNQKLGGELRVSGHILLC